MSMTEPVNVAEAPPPPTAEELQTYAAMVAEVARAADGRVIVNRSDAHAAVVIEHIFRSAKTEVDILTGELYEPIYCSQRVIDAATDFVRSGGLVRILSEKVISPDHRLLSALKQIRPDVDCCVMTKAVSEKTPFHFSVADARYFRFEPDKKTFEAYAQFGEPSLGARLKATFDRLRSAVPYQG